MQQSRPKENLVQIWISKQTKKKIRELKKQGLGSQVQIVEEAIEEYYANQSTNKK